ncbi:kinesin family protein [Arthroderma uncinatum]|uniref:kinesin family protein n=1 Tax=Arthroderma uncinatum TaxID=74035 RepID=UPI00144A58C1|nr:kinesin family protein [Arthroderma uncinatum]KAF3483863.1 kinesin family protein [Arthroderma uncinatum]
MAASGGASSIQVTVRVRPFTIKEAAQLAKCDEGMLFMGDGSLAGTAPKLQQKGLRSIIKVVDGKCLVFDPPEDNPLQRFSRSVIPNRAKRGKDQTFMFDRVFDENTTQGDVYEASTKHLLDSVLEGYNATVFAYGATGCGKTHTITGTPQQPGIIFLTMQELFEKIAERSEERVTELSLSYLEIYNETIRDLLLPGGSKQGLMLREDANQTVSVPGLSTHRPQNVQEVMDMIMRGNEYRTMSPTEANETSSRSHAVLQINVAQKDRNSDLNEPHTMATLSIIDLAGSERASATKNRGERLVEGANINKSLLALGSCINALCDPRKRNHVPYRNSKLTRLLKFSLGGNCKTVMIVCVSPASHHFDETQNTLRYANRAKNIQTKVTRNVYNVNRHIKDFLVKIDEQIALINELKQQQKEYETIAFAKFKKQNEKKEAVLRESIARLRSAYEHAAPERQEKTNCMVRLKQVSRRVSMLSAWIAAFDNVCAARGQDDTMQGLHAIRKSAQGILFELEGSRQHYHQKIGKSSWERSIDSALEVGIRQLRELETSDNTDIENLKREAELLKSNAEYEALSAVSEQDKTGEFETTQRLLEANFETISAIEHIMQLSEEEAIDTGKKILGKLLETCCANTTNVVKPNGSSPAKTEAFPLPRNGTPKRRKRISLISRVSLSKPLVPPVTITPPVNQTPMKGSPRRRRGPGLKKGVYFTPKKLGKPNKRSVRWKDDAEDGPLAEFEKTPQKPQLSPQPFSGSPSSLPVPTMASSIPLRSGSRETSPMPTLPPMPSTYSKNSRFQTGFLSKKTNEGSPGPAPAPPSLTRLSLSDTEQASPLRQISNSSTLNRRSLDRESNTHSSDGEDPLKIDKLDAARISSAMRRISGSGPGPGGPTNRPRHRSPSVASNSPPNENTMFTASQARRMVKSEKDQEGRYGVLSPRTFPVTKPGSQRRVTSVDLKMRDVSNSSRDGVRFSTTAIPSAGQPRPNLQGSGPSACR